MWETLVIWVVLTVVGAALIKRPKSAPPAKLSDFDAPTARLDRTITEVLGTRWVKGYNVCWWGDLHPEAIRQSTGRKYAFFGPKQYVTTAYKYSLGMHQVICRRADRVLGLRVGDRDASSQALASNGSVYVNQPQLFGDGVQDEGVVGLVDIAFGRPGQTANDYLEAHQPLCPAYLGVVAAILRRVYVGNSTTVRAWSWLVSTQSCEDGWYSARAAVGAADMNPAHIIREALVNIAFSDIGAVPSELDDASFRRAADYWHAQGIGLSMEISSDGMTGEEFIGEVLRHVDASLYEDPETGLWTLAPHLDADDVDALLVLDASNCTVESFERVGYGNTVNRVVAEYYDRDSGQMRPTTPVSNPAAIELQGGVVQHVVQYPGITSADLASRKAAEDLVTLGTDLCKCRLRAGRHAHTLRPGGLFLWRSPRHGVRGVLMRVVSVNFGTLAQPAIRIDAVEAVSANVPPIFAPPPASGWVDPVQAPAASPQRLLQETPLHLLRTEQIGPEADALPAASTLAMAVASAPSSGALDVDAWARVGAAAFAEVEAGAIFGGTAQLGTALPRTEADATVTLANIQHAEGFAVGAVLAIGGEILRVSAVTGGSYVLQRGWLDTVAAKHAVDAAVYSLVDPIWIDETWPVGQTLQLRLLPATLKGRLALASAPTDSLPLVGRAHRPYPPGRLRIDGQAYPSTRSGASIAASWAHRDRLSHTPVAQSAGDVGPEAGVTYTVRWYRNGTLATTQTGVTATTTTWTPPASGLVRVEVEAVRASLASIQRLTHEFEFTLEP